jgi:phage shock protein C
LRGAEERSEIDPRVLPEATSATCKEGRRSLFERALRPGVPQTPGGRLPDMKRAMDTNESGRPGGTGTRELRRSKTDRMVAGVAGGLARYFGIDPILVRVAFVVFTLAGGSGVLAYLILWLVVPEESEAEAGASTASVPAPSAHLLQVLFGAVLVAAGTIFLIDQVVPWFDRVIWPATLILLGAIVLLHGAKRD